MKNLISFVKTFIPVKDEALDRELILAAYLGQPDRIQELLMAGANIETQYEHKFEKNKDSATPLLLCSLMNGNEDSIKCLIDRGANVNAVNKNTGKNSLHYLVEVGECNAIRLLLAAGADVKHADHDGYTPLHSATLQSDVCVIQLLLDYGADIRAKNQEGLTAADLAMQKLQKGNRVSAIADYLNTAAENDTLKSLIIGVADNSCVMGF